MDTEAAPDRCAAAQERFQCFVAHLTKVRYFESVAATLLCRCCFLPVSTSVWRLRPVGLRYASDYL